MPPNNQQPNAPYNEGQPEPAGSVIAPGNNGGLPEQSFPSTLTPGVLRHPLFRPGPAIPPPSSLPPQPAAHKSGRRKKLLLLVPIAVLLLGGSAAAYLGYYVPNKPQNLWGKSMLNMGKGYDRLADYLKNYKGGKGYKIGGSFKLSGAFASDGDIDSLGDGSNSRSKVNISAGGVKLNLQVLTIKSSGQYPDIYLKASGIDGLDQLLGTFDPALGKSLGSINNQWYFVDHSLFDQMSQSSSPSTFSRADINEVVTAAEGPSKKYVFTDDKSKMAFVVKQQIGKEKQDNHSVYHYKIGVNKANLKAYNQELCTSLSKTKLFKTLEGSSDAGQALKDCKDTSDIGSIKDSDTADVWVDMRTKLVHKVRFAEKEKKDNYFDVFQDYQGGDKLPFGAAFNSSDGITGSINFNLDMATNILTLDGSFNSTGQTKENGNLNLKLEPNNSAVQVQKPANAKNIMQLLNDLGLSDLLGDAQGSAKDTERKTDINALVSQMEVYYTDSGSYPSLAEVNNAAWRAANMKGSDPAALKDPDGSTSQLAAKPAAHVYSYQPSPAGCDNAKVKCTDYTLTAILDNGSAFVKKSLNSGTNQTILQ
jgi:hypothetical protein